ncbi:AAA family ATPase [candidate division WOR-1 bacterium RIFOXYB2_FULL_42_35]|uniref:Replication-associated recombination protein A n=1 Tax=candidate division WOR-1 bacterium RIFOXYC2_FULL_41_25 TaxID=1802586 RepID=A0A1F4TPS6_UNCSA|nr:MAG: AAA family ATPase [candidate division WOR-1 bacterium RIFOXYB2_FULL_42_35]OGC24524.1 MAG: AAA family ATPase [candidate division WOR-1 bacterium RIFOXYA2_FULL_41_14]OGC34569.1 MAG: AAA family ATPase [candidate division WOR-1 bacterium RIFOXYC2_FULL_41_25]OGC43722.1 MAG: AAA family ATPase [candidate division WOR-1 bacterium RIFOXYD2_FULL_41_8]
MDLFDKNLKKNTPLPFRMAPRNLDEMVGQEDILGEGKLLRRLVEADKVSSLILHGPPGTGKTALARVIANTTKGHFEWLNASTAKVDDIRKVSIEAKNRKKHNLVKTILFLDEIHRFNKLQQDVLLPDVEEGLFILIGATTENPFFYVNSALVSRSQIFELKPLSTDNLKALINRAIKDKERGLGNIKLKINDEAINHLTKISDGDARKALSALELAALSTLPDKKGTINLDLKVAEESIQKKAVVYDKHGEQHYDTISAFIKSMRGSDPDAALYYLAKMIYAGEDPRFIARRIVICAAEDVGNADPLALVVANSAMQVAEFVGMPEARIPLAQATTYVATAPKSNAAYVGIDAALKDVKENPTLPVPNHLKNAVYDGEKKMGKGKGYKYAHNYEGGVVEQEHLTEKRKYYEPKDIGFEKKIRARMNPPTSPQPESR